MKRKFFRMVPRFKIESLLEAGMDEPAINQKRLRRFRLKTSDGMEERSGQPFVEMIYAGLLCQKIRSDDLHHIGLVQVVPWNK